MANFKGVLGAGLITAGQHAGIQSERMYKDDLLKREEEAQAKAAANKARLEQAAKMEERSYQERTGLEKETRAADARKEEILMREGLFRGREGKEKPPAFHTFKNDELVLTGGDFAGTHKNVEVAARYTPEAPDVGLGPGMVPVAIHGIKDLGSAAWADQTDKLNVKYKKDMEPISFADQQIFKIRQLLAAPRTPENTKAIKSELTGLVQTSSRALKEVQSWGNLGNLPERVFGGLQEFLAGNLLESQYKGIEDMLDVYQENIIPAVKQNVDSYYTERAKSMQMDPKVVTQLQLLSQAATGESVLPKSERQSGTTLSAWDFISIAENAKHSKEDIIKEAKVRGVVLPDSYTLKESLVGRPEGFR